MIAASSLVVAVLAAYAGLAMLSVSAVTPLGPFVRLPGVSQIVSGIGWSKPDLAKVIKVKDPTTGLSTLPVAGGQFVDFTKTHGAPVSVTITNSSSTPLTLVVSVPDNQNLTARFSNGLSKATLGAHQPAMVTVSNNNPLAAGPITGQLTFTASGLTSFSVPIIGAQAPMPPGAVTATPVAGGAVDLSWAPSTSTSGVLGYIVERSTDGTTWSQVGDLTTGTTLVDQTPSDNTYTYEVKTVAVGSPGLVSAPGPTATATSDATAPDPPSMVTAPAITAKNVANLSVTVALDPTTSPSDTITVTLTGPSGRTATGTAPGGSPTVVVPVQNASALSESADDQIPTIAVSATATDSLGNVSKPVSGAPVVKDTIAPGAPSLLSLPEITQQNDRAYPVAFEPSAPSDPTYDTIHVSAQAVDADGQPIGQPVQQFGSVGDGPVPIDLSGLPDGNVQVTAWITDQVGNKSTITLPTTVAKDTGSPAPTEFEVAPGPSNPAGVVTPQSAHSVYITATFAQAPTADDEIKVFANQHTLVDQPGDGQTTDFTFGPFDFSDVGPGQHKLGMMQIDGLGNKTWFQTQFTVDTGATGPTSVGVPAGPNNPAGYVNAATQTAATIVASFAGPTDAADTIALSVDGLTLATESGGSDQNSWTADLSSLPDGTLQILGTLTDPNGVSTTFTGTLIKDTQAPPAPAAANVISTPPDTIDNSNVSCVNVGVEFNQAPDPSDTVTVTLSDGTTSVQGSAQAGNGQVTVPCMDASSLADGPISMSVTVTDVAGNSVTVAGTPATKLSCQNQGG